VAGVCLARCSHSRRNGSELSPARCLVGLRGGRWGAAQQAPQSRSSLPAGPVGGAQRTAKRIRFVHLLDQRGPAFAGLWCRGRTGGNPGSGTGRRFPLRPLASRLVRVPSVVSHQMDAQIGDVLRHLGQEVQRIEHLEVAGRSGQQFVVPRFGESAHGIMFGFIDHLARLGHLDHPGLAEGTAQEVLDEALHALLIADFQAHALVDAEC